MNQTVSRAVLLSVMFFSPAILSSPEVAAACSADQHAVAVKPVAPDFPQQDVAKIKIASSKVLVTIDKEGRPVRAEILSSSGHRELDQACLAAAMNSIYRPEIKNCKRVTGLYIQVYNFSG